MITRHNLTRKSPDHEGKRDGENINNCESFEVERIKEMKQNEGEGKEEKIYGKKE